MCNICSLKQRGGGMLVLKSKLQNKIQYDFIFDLKIRSKVLLEDLGGGDLSVVFLLVCRHYLKFLQ